jgi:hypothetical protein
MRLSKLISEKEIIHIVVGFVVSAIIPAAIISVIWPLDRTRYILSMVGSFGVFYPFSLGAVVVLGLPSFAVLRPFRPGRWWFVVPVGFFLGTLVDVVLKLRRPDLLNIVTDGILGVPAALVFWWIWRMSGADVRPKNDAS